ncbi:hypothetical protein Y032_0218g2425 [Ancylostoma ceylanicum]|uniref:Uncharacterized protein n=1 Tax=Ancylostoma ceylanicum TaxID=53326 RepID=A0A016SJN8_9BILA|nr:hypothetical protein Y032_0218g2425 [Ancylostoma ceylanicum]
MHYFPDIRHHWYEHSDLNARVLSKELLVNQRFAQVDLIYPDIDMEVEKDTLSEEEVNLSLNRYRSPLEDERNHA